MTERLIPLSEAAHLLGLSWGQAWRLVLQHELEGEKVKGRWMVSASGIEKRLRRRRPLPEKQSA